MEGQQTNELDKRAKAAYDRMNSAWIVALLLAVVATIGLFVTKL